jgi:hypothetical protein
MTLTWLGSSIWYGLTLTIALWLHNRQQNGLLPVFVFFACLAFLLSPLFGVSVVYGITFTVGILLSWLTWWYTRQIVKPRYAQPPIVWRMSFSLLASFIFLFAVLPILIWEDWKVALVVAVTSVLTSMKAGAVSTDDYALKRAAEISDQNPSLDPSQALAQAEAEMTVNVDDTPDPILDPHADNHRLLVDAAERTVSDLLSELDIGLRSPFRLGIVLFVLYSFHLRIGQFFGEKAAERLRTECETRFAGVAGTSSQQFSSLYRRYAPAFYAVDNWFHHGGPSDRDESFRTIVAAEKYWEIIANGPNADTSRRSNPHTKPQDPGGSLSLMHLETRAAAIGNFCKNLAQRGVRL